MVLHWYHTEHSKNEALLHLDSHHSAVSCTTGVVSEHPLRSVVDLSRDLVDDTSRTSTGALEFARIASSDPLLRAAVVLENGKVVAKYYRGDPQVDPDTPNQVWSTTKSWTSLLIGLLVDEGKLSVEETLGDIFTDEAVWADVADARKNITVHEMLTMSSGLHTPAAQSIDKMLELSEEEVPATLEALLNDGGITGGGTSLSHSLAFPDTGVTGEFHYLGSSQILSYVITERSGMTPREYLAAKVMPALGIKEDEYNWLQNADGVELAFHGLEVTAMQMAKFGQLYLQGGQSKPGHQIISRSWVNADSFQQHRVDPDLFKMPYGYLFWAVSSDMYCTIGVCGQDTCINRKTGRVYAQQRDCDPSNLMSGNLLFSELASDPTPPFDAMDENEAEGTPPQLESCSDGKLEQ
ncbi:hypothetical protein ACHAXT_007756 [Thalassiosira profunda]